MNLYQVWLKDCEYSYFVFAENKNKAKAACVERNSVTEQYIYLRCKTLAKDIPNFPVEDLGFVVVVEDKEDIAYEIVKELGFEFDEADY